MTQNESSMWPGGPSQHHQDASYVGGADGATHQLDTAPKTRVFVGKAENTSTSVNARKMQVA